MKKTKKSQFHITVAATLNPNIKKNDLQSGLNVANDLRLLKAALLYSDKVKFYSYGVSALLNQMNLPKKMRENEKLDWILEFYQDLGHSPHIEQVTKFVDDYRESLRNKKRNFQAYLLNKRALDKSFRDMKKLANEAGIKGLNDALASGLIDFCPFSKKEHSVEQYVDAVSNALISKETYPLLDDATGELIELLIKEEKIAVLGTSEKRAKHVGLSSKLIEKLPLFDFASVDEILDIRKDLEIPLVRFRAAVIGYANMIENLPWKGDFSLEVEEIYLQHVEPAILDLENAYKSSKSLLNIFPKTLQYKGIAATSVLGLAISQLNQFPKIVVPLSIAGALTLGTYEAVRERRQEIEKVENHQLFFYYKAASSLSK